MARGYAKISITLWQSRKFRGTKENIDARLMYFYLHSCPQVNGVGCFSLPIGYAATDLGWDEVRILSALEALQTATLIDWDHAESMVRIIGFLEHDPPTNPKHASAMVTTLRSVHDGKLKLSVVEDLLGNKHCADNVELFGLRDSLSRGYREGVLLSYPVPSPVPDPSLREGSAKGASSKPKRGRKALSALPENCPTESDRDAARLFWQDRGRADLCARLGDEASSFRDHHSAHGKRMVDWSAAWRTWYGNAVRFQRPPKGLVAQQTGVFEQTDERGWTDRIRVWRTKAMWTAKWGPKPDEPGCRCPPEILQQDIAA